MTWLEWIEFLIPCSRWIRIYKWREFLQLDLMAGITVGVMLVPQVTLLLRFVAEKITENVSIFVFFPFFLSIVYLVCTTLLIKDVSGV